MAGSDKKVQQYTSFNAGEYSPELAGRVDLESFGSSSRFMSNMMSQISGGVKKFYGTTHVAEVTPEIGRGKVKFIPFVTSYEPMMLVVFGKESEVFVEDDDETQEGLSVGLIYGDNYRLLDMKLPNTIEVDELRWKQINDRMVLCHPSIQPITIDFYGVDENGDYVFKGEDAVFDEIPYFPVGATNDYFGELNADRLDGTVTISIPTGTSDLKFELTPLMIAQSTYTRSANIKCNLFGYTMAQSVSVADSTVEFFRDRNGTVTSLASGKINTYTLTNRPSHEHNVNVTDRVTQEKILQVIRTIAPSSYISGSFVVTPDLPGHVNGDQYYMQINIGLVRYRKAGHSSFRDLWAAQTETSDITIPTVITTGTLDIESLQGRKIKFYFNDDTTISPWWQGKVVSDGDYAYSNGHWYKAMGNGTCGNIQPSHTFGIHSDGGVAWKYVHSGSTSATVSNVIDSSSFQVCVKNGQELPATNKTGDGKYIYKNYAWCIWGKSGVHPSNVYMAGNRLGFICNTAGYGAWNALSVTDDFFNFSTEEYGEQLDTSAIVHLIANNESGVINWVLSRKNVYMGSYSGEYNVRGIPNDVLTPTGTVVENISNMGGEPIIPLKYKELNMFVGLTGKELYTIGYDYTIEDYTPHSLGYLTQHIMERGVHRIEALNNIDRNIYLLHDTKQLSLFNYAREQKVMGFSELDLGSDVLDFATTYANDVVAGYVATYRNTKSATISQTRGDTLSDITVDVEKFSRMIGTDGSYGFEYGVGDWYHNSEVVNLDDYGISFTGTPHNTDELTVEYKAQKITFERLATADPKYMWDTVKTGNGTLDDFTPIPHLANKDVWIRYGEDLSQFARDTLDENGEPTIILPQSKYFEVGIPMMSEIHTQPAFGMKVEGHQQQSIYLSIRLNKSGAFDYGSSVDFTKYFEYDYWTDGQEWDGPHILFTGDATLNIPLGYAENANQGHGPYPNTTGVGVNIRSDKPEPLNILSIQEIYR